MGVGRRGWGEIVCSGLWLWSGGIVGGFIWSREGFLILVCGKSKMVVLVEIEKDDGCCGGGSGVYVI